MPGLPPREPRAGATSTLTLRPTPRHPPGSLPPTLLGLSGSLLNPLLKQKNRPGDPSLTFHYYINRQHLNFQLLKQHKKRFIDIHTAGIKRVRPQDSEESLLSASQAKADVKGCMCPRPAPQQLHPAPASAHTVRIQGGQGGGPGQASR